MTKTPATRGGILATARTSHVIEALATVPGRTDVFARCGDCLFRINEARLTAAARDGGYFDFDRSSDAPLIAAGVEFSGRPTIVGDTMCYARRGGIEIIHLPQGDSAARPPMPALPGPVIDVCVAPGDKSAICVVRDESDIDLYAYHVFAINVSSRTASLEPLLTASQRPEIAWSAAGAFFIYDPCGERLFRFAPAQKEATRIEIPAARGRSLAGVLIHPADRLLAALLRDSADGSLNIGQAIVTQTELRWDTVARLPSGLHRLFRWRPGGHEIMAIRTVRRTNTIAIYNALGNPVITQDLPRGWFVNDAAWSGDGRRIFVAGSVGVGVFTPATAGNKA